MRRCAAGTTTTSIPALPRPRLSVTAELLATSTLATSQREAYLSFVMDERRAAPSIRAAGGGPAGAAVVLIRRLHALTAAIGNAELEIEDWLGPRDLAEVIRTAFDPHVLGPLAERRAAAFAAAAAGRPWPGLVPGVDPGAAGPAGAEARPGVYLHDGASSVTYWVHDWPRSQVYCTVLAPAAGGRGSPALVQPADRAARPARGRTGSDARTHRPPRRGPHAPAHRPDRARA